MKRSFVKLAAVLGAASLLLAACGGSQSGAAQETVASSSAETTAAAESAEPESSKTETAEETAEDTGTSAAESEAETKEAAPADVITGGTSQEDAEEIPLGMHMHGTYREGETWVSFTTGAVEGVPYTVTLVNLSADSDDLDMYLFDETGEQVVPTKRNNDNYYKPICIAHRNGTAAYGMIDTLAPDTSYYLRLTGKSKTKYSLCVSSPDHPFPENPALRGSLSAEEENKDLASNQDDAPLLEEGVRYNGKYVDGCAWFAFHTGSEEDVPYTVTLENLTAGSEDLYMYLFDQHGRQLRATERDNDDYYGAVCRARQNGTANSAMTDTLLPDQTYFLQLSGKSKARFSLVLSTPEYALPDDITLRDTADKENEIADLASNQDAAPIMEDGVRYNGNYQGGCAWFAFHTGPEEDVPYTMTLENLTVGSEDLYMYLFDGYGRQLRPSKRNNTDYYGAACIASQNGTANSAMIDTLLPDTTYYLRISGKGKVRFVVTVSSPASGGMSSEGSAEGSSVEAGSSSGSELVIPGTSQSYALNVPLGTKVFSKYTGGYAWLAFTTTDTEDAEYYVTLVNCTPHSEDLYAYVFDETGTRQNAAWRDNVDYYRAASVAKWSGTGNTGIFNSLKPNTTYYVRVQGNGKTEYSLVVNSPSAKSTAYSTSSSLSEAKRALSEEDEFYTGTNQNIATMLKTNTKYHGHYEDGYAWVAFTTGSEEDTPYTVTLENLTVGSEDLYLYFYDEYGRQQIPTERNNSDYYKAMCIARQDGTANSGMIDTLLPDTTYYLRISGKSKADYMLTIGEPLPEGSGNTINEAEVSSAESEGTVVPEPEPEPEVIFEVPFELNETQVRFKAESADFVDPAAVEEALAPVAEIILQYPEHKILLAGTTATDGSQEARVILSNQRAEAVRTVLTETFHVPEDQILTIGLGFEADPFVRGKDRDGNGKFVETEGAKNRRVIVMDADSAIAQEILGQEAAQP